MNALITTFTAAMLLTAIAPAADDKPPGPPKGGHGKPNPEEVFKKLDSNADGNVSLEEFKAGPRTPKDETKAQEIFGKIDADANGSISAEEFKAHRPPHGPGSKGGPDGGQEDGGKKDGGKKDGGKKDGGKGGKKGGPGGGPKGPPKGGPGGPGGPGGQL